MTPTEVLAPFLLFLFFLSHDCPDKEVLARCYMYQFAWASQLSRVVRPSDLNNDFTNCSEQVRLKYTLFQSILKQL